MTITEFAILPFKSPPELSDPTLHALFQTLSAWQSECSGFPLRFFIDVDEPCQVHLVTGWNSIAAREAWIRGERNQELLRVFAPYVDIPRVRMVHVDVELRAIPNDGGMVVERYQGGGGTEGAGSTVFETERANGQTWSVFGRGLGQDDGDVYRFVGVDASGEAKVGHEFDLIERWMLKGVEL